MRVISGSAKGIRLSGVPGKSTRPITDQVKEALFNILGPWIRDKHVLDLFGGTGAVGIEALSRGAAYAHFLDTNYRAYQTIHQNLRTTRLEGRATVQKKDAFVFLNEEIGDQFDLIYIAPPQYKDIWLKALLAVDNKPGLLDDDGMIIVQIHPKEFQDSISLQHLHDYDSRNYGDTQLVFYEKVLT